jgi:putative restriction endonuclease
MRDDDVRSSCFASLDVLCARFGDEIPYPEGLATGFSFRGSRVPFLSTQKGIYRAAAQRGPAALSIQTSWKSPYGDAEVETGYLYAYRSGPIDQPDNRALRAAFTLGAPIVHFVSTRPNYYKPIYPCFVVEDDPGARRVLVSPGKMVGPLDEQEPVVVEDPIERIYVFRETRVRVHQARFRARVVPAYRDRCAICSLKERQLLDAAHIVGDVEEHGEPLVSNGLSLCSIHHRAFDQDLVAVTPDYEVRVAQRLLDEDDGPMLDVLKGFDMSSIVLPTRVSSRPDRDRLAMRYERFVARNS